MLEEIMNHEESDNELLLFLYESGVDLSGLVFRIHEDNEGYDCAGAKPRNGIGFIMGRTPNSSLTSVSSRDCGCIEIIRLNGNAFANLRGCMGDDPPGFEGKLLHHTTKITIVSWDKEIKTEKEVKDTLKEKVKNRRITRSHKIQKGHSV